MRISLLGATHPLTPPLTGRGAGNNGSVSSPPVKGEKKRGLIRASTYYK